MMQVIEQTHEEKVAMYMKLPKKKLIEMLIECNRLLEAQSQAGEYFVQPVVSGQVCLQHQPMYQGDETFTGNNTCVRCGQIL